MTTDPRALKLLILQQDNQSNLDNATRALQRLDNFTRRAQPLLTNTKQETQKAQTQKAQTQLAQEIQEGIDAVGAVALMFYKVRETNTLIDEDLPEQAAESARLAVLIADFFRLSIGTENVDVPDEVQSWVDARTEARQLEDFKVADEMKERIELAGWLVEDTDQGSIAIPAK